MDDEKIVELFLVRSEQAISETKDSYGAYCTKICSNILKSREDTEECVNDAYMKLWETIPPQRPRSLKAYLSKIIRNLALDRYEKNHAKKRGSGKADAVFEEIEQFYCSRSDELADSIAIRDAVNRFLGTIDKQQRVLFVQRYWFFCTVKEIAKMHGLGESKVKMTLKRTRDDLRIYLQKEGIGV